MIIAEYTLDHPILRYTLNAVPGIEVTWEDSYSTSEGRTQMLVWVESDDVGAVEAALAADPTVTNPTVITESGGRRLYRLDFEASGRETSIMPLLVEVGGVHLEVVATADGWRNRSRFPNREAFERVYRFCRDRDIDFAFDRLYEEADRSGTAASGGAPRLTDAQIETLIEAVDSGYLSIPRQCSLAELGERLGISESAASERFRRAVRSLVQGTVHPESARGPPERSEDRDRHRRNA